MSIKQVRNEQPLIHCITNMVVANFQANGLLALGVSPVMADSVEEAAETSAISACTVLNIGTLRTDVIEAMLLAGKSANEHGKPVVLDPVGAGATSFRKQTALKLLEEIDVALIRCNAGELAAIANVPWEAKGVDAGKGDADIEKIAKEVAIQHECIVAVCGEIDIVTDGYDVTIIRGGHHFMASMTGTGCLLSSVAGAFLAVRNDNQLDTVAAALTFYKQVGEKAAEHSSGLGHFAVEFINALEGVYE